MAEKLAPPTPTMMIDMGRREAAMMALLVSAMSDIAPSVSMSRMKYCYRNIRQWAWAEWNIAVRIYKTCISVQTDITLVVWWPNLNFHVLLGLCCKRGHMVDDGGKVRGSPEFHRSDGIVIGSDHALYSSTIRVWRVPIEGKLVRYLSVDLSSKSKSWEELVTEINK